MTTLLCCVVKCMRIEIVIVSVRNRDSIVYVTIKHPR